MRRTKLTAVAVVAVALVAAGGLAAADGEVAQDEMVTIDVGIEDNYGVSIGSADVRIEWDGGSTEVTTRSNGHVLVDVPEGADLEFHVTHDDYVRNVPHEVSDVQADQEVGITMRASATAEIEVVDEDGPVEDVRVQLRRHGQNAWADQGETDADGVWTSGEIEEGTYSVRVTNPGYYEVTRTVDLAGAASETVEIEEGDVTIDLYVQDPTPEGPGSVSANVDVSHDGDHVISVTTTDAGERSVSLAVNTRYDVEVTRDEYRSTTSVLRTGEEREAFSVNVTRVANLSLSAANQQVVVGQNLRVEVTDEYDRPVEGATVTVGGEDAGETDAEGVARVEISEEGDVEVAATDGDIETDPITVTGVTAGAADGGGDGDEEGSAAEGDEGDDGEQDGEGDEEDDDGDDGSDGTPGFGVVPALLALLLACAAASRRR